MITQAQIRKKALAPWNSGAFLAGCVDGTTIFPLPIRFRTPSGKTVLENYDAVRTWIQTLRDHSKESVGSGYEITWQSIRHRSLGDQKLPQSICFPTSSDWLAFIQKEEDHDAFAAMVEKTRRTLPGLLTYLSRKPLKALGQAPHWATILTICRWFMDHPSPGKFIRQLDIAGVDTKFIEAHRSLLMDLLPLVIGPEGMNSEVSGLSKHGFERKFGLLYDPPLVRIRLLDKSLCHFGFSDLSVPLDQLVQTDLGAKRVFVTENKINGLAFPHVSRSIVIFGLGYGIKMLRKLRWLEKKEMHYWGDIDTHGFAILSQIRGYFPQVHSLLMDRQILMTHADLWGCESPDKRFSGSLAHLTNEENELFCDLKNNRMGPCIRLEQERIRFSVLQKALHPLNGQC
jgi:hypothetical protein